MTKVGFKTAKAKAWKAFSWFIRLRDCVRTTGTLEEGQCFTCGQRLPISELEAGHLFPGRKGENLWDERGVHAQCMRCNRILNGNQEIYERRMIEQYSRAVVDELRALVHIPTDFSAADYVEMADAYKLKAASLSTNHRHGTIRFGNRSST